MNKRKQDTDSDSDSGSEAESGGTSVPCAKCGSSKGDYFWSCDICSGWFHPKCTGLPKKAQEALQAQLDEAQDSNEEPQWTCQSCLDSKKVKKNGPSSRPWEWSKSEEKQMLQKFDAFLQRKLS
eukprot:TRINITY_DN2504_c4_g1_i1.p1 TRINITY_DN2504_c4_g1~~TRINITY_DN2504_c4_g1_i1.p1  ORF type:complete len:124 (+),score=19.21 TRINITY_DN2504_c4_g1_i1:546-917(+)